VLLELVAVSRFREELREAYRTRTFQFWYHSMDIHFNLFHVEFEDGLYISILKIRATHYKNLQLETVKFLKKSNLFKSRPPTLFPTPPFSNSGGQGLIHWCMSELPR
jgi:hypothetical protein